MDQLSSLGRDTYRLAMVEAGSHDRRLAVTVGIILIAAFVVTAPFAARPLAHIPSFVPGYDTAIIILDAITALLLYAQYKDSGERSFLALACGYAFTPIVVAAHGLSFPDAFVPGSLIGEDQTTAWLWMAWHAVFPLFVIAYALKASAERAGKPHALWMPGRAAIALAIGLAAALVALVLLLDNRMPRLMAGTVYQSTSTKWILACGWSIHLIGLGLLAYVTRLRRLLDLWIGVVLLALLIDLALSALLVTGRYELGFYAGRCYGLLANLFVLGLLLRQAMGWQGWIARAESRFATLFGSMDEAFYLVQIIRDDEGAPVDLLYLEENTAAVRQTGIRTVGRRLRKVHPEFEREWLTILDEVVRSGEPRRFEKFSPVTKRWHSYHVFPAATGADQAGVLASDISERRDTEDALRTSEEQYRSLFEEMDEGFALCELVRDAAGHAVDYRYIELNPALQRHAGICPDDFKGRCAQEAFPDLDPWHLETFSGVVDRRQSVLVERYYPHVDRWLRLNAFPRGGDRFAVLFNDITDAKRAEAALQASEERQAFLLKLADALRPLTNAAEIKATATHVLGEHLRVSRAQYYNIDPSGEYFVADGGYGPAAYVGQARMEDFGAYLKESYRAGKTVAVGDVSNDPRIDASEVASYGKVGLSAFVGVPLIKGGRFVGTLGIAQETPREWTPHEVALVEETAERTWAAVERARAEAALRESEEKYRDLFTSMDEAYAVVEVLKDNEGRWFDFRFMEVNPAFMKHTTMPYPVGKTATELLGTPNPRWTELYGQALDTGEPLRVEETEHTLAKTFDLNIFALDRERSRVAVLFTDITERKKVEQALRESERLRTAMLDIVPIGLGLVDLDGRVIVANPEWQRFLPNNVIPSRDAEHGARWRGWDDSGKLIEPNNYPSARALRGETVHPPMEFLYTDSDGREIWTGVASLPLRDGDDNIIGAVSVIQDIDAERRAAEAVRESERHARLLMAELQHRVRNVLALIRSIVRRTSNNKSDVTEFVDHLEGRIDAMARTQAMLTRAPGRQVDLEELIRDEMLAQSAPERQYKVKGPAVGLSAHAAEVLTLAVHELATNSVKYGALGSERGKLTISWSCTSDDGKQQLQFRWQETGVTDQHSGEQGFGTELITKRVPYELNGTGQINIDRGTLTATIEFPLEEKGSMLETEMARPTGESQ